ncbi:MAG: hypothetical protein ACREHD_32950, partial [Pirellulales bacterium]
LNVSLGHNGEQLPVAVINVRQKNDIISLAYDLYEAPQWSGPSPASRFWTDDDQVIWLYDEIALLNDTKFSHEILLSNGKVLRLVFFQFSFFINRSISVPSEALSA